MGAFSTWHLVIVLVIVLIIFGPGKLPQVGKSLGNAISEFKKSVNAGKEDEENKKKDDEPHT